MRYLFNFALIAVALIAGSAAVTPAKAQEPFIGQITWFAGNFAPRGWAFCDGQPLLISQNQALFSILGTTYGGDGRTTFALPDMRGRSPVHEGSGPGLPTVRLGEKGGATSFTMTQNQMPSHTHTSAIKALEEDAVLSEPNSSAVLAIHPGGPSYAPSDGAEIAISPNSVLTNNTGGGQAVNLRSPYTSVNCIIALVGVFPPRN